ncbi:CRISPR-associated protein, Cas5e family [Kytococcus aerolatus]|uniref:CRISPR-associated protein, Cas5e family n=1 Tax=Kytococcus aerolatus TaxID=592308 RepID=A0A212U5H6_9MICO|nr:CRISPR-associated protein, Cas5e family [Kytococcus aerolatus]
MTACLPLVLSGPMHAWGTTSRFPRRDTAMEPSKSGVLGLLAAAQGRRRTEEISDLAGLAFGVRVDHPGRLIRDFQTAVRPAQGRGSDVRMPLSERFYVADAVYLAVVEGPEGLVDELSRAVRSPRFPLFLGRRSCPPDRPVGLPVAPGALEEVLEAHPWLGPERLARRRARTVSCQVVRDARPGEKSTSREPDVPVSFDPRRREFGWRSVIRTFVDVTNPAGTEARTASPHDPIAELL